MVPRPGTTGSEDGHQIKQEPEARAPTTDGSSPNTLLARTPASPQIYEGTSVAPDIKVEVKKEEYEEKYPVPVMAAPEAIKGSATQHSPPGSSVKSRSSKDDPMPHKTSKTTRKKGMPMKAPDEEEEEMKPPVP
ncbi:hypothetical protein PR003_g19879 [Phytophthora rubi]|uniref:Uncharacterized protein n=1 Tax=Phytophthora rubi TaxID=129364 RepID=A0A6A3GGV4_9STRA|nr:hypothetical protein PR002_g31707 [Phytophthora rubi]KAE9311980.1 hypothetical protein PR003_g19879 [Phytophthora rubi]